MAARGPGTRLLKGFERSDARGRAFGRAPTTVGLRSVSLSEEEQLGETRRRRNFVAIAPLQAMYWRTRIDAGGETHVEPRMAFVYYLRVTCAFIFLADVVPIFVAAYRHGVTQFFVFLELALIGSIPALMPFLAERLRKIVRPSSGMLDRLLATHDLPDADLTMLVRAEGIKAGVVVFWVVAWQAITSLYEASALDPTKPGHSTLPQVLVVAGVPPLPMILLDQVVMALVSINVGVVLLSYYLCLLLGSRLAIAKCRHVVEVINAADPHTDVEWEKPISPGLRSLHEDILLPLSLEFGPPLVVICMLMALVGIVALPHVLTGTQETKLSASYTPLIALFWFLAFALPPATATTEANKIFNALNQLRCLRASTGLSGFVALPTLERIAQLEAYFERLNGLQGPGFALHPPGDPELTLVVSLRNLYSVLAQTAVLFSVIFPGARQRRVASARERASRALRSPSPCVRVRVRVRAAAACSAAAAPAFSPSFRARPFPRSHGRHLRGRRDHHAWARTQVRSGPDSLVTRTAQLLFFTLVAGCAAGFAAGVAVGVGARLAAPGASAGMAVLVRDRSPKSASSAHTTNWKVGVRPVT